MAAVAVDTGFRRVHRHQTPVGPCPWPDRPYQPSPAEVCSWLRQYLGPQGFKLLGWYREVIGHLYGQPRPMEAIVSIPKGNGKTTLMAALSVYELMGRGRPESQVLQLATTAGQAYLCFGAAMRMIERSEPLASRSMATWVYGHERVNVPRLGSFMQPLPVRDPRSLQGWTPAFAVVDEMGFTDPETWTAMTQAVVKRKGAQVVGVGTPGYDQTGVMFRRRQMAQERPVATFWYREWAAPSDAPLWDLTAWKQSNPGLGVVKSLPAMRHLFQTSDENEFRTLQLGQWAGHVKSWLQPGVWDSLPRVESQPPEGATVCLGFDGSASYDSTALVWAAEGAVGSVQIWDRPGQDKWQVPIDQVTDVIRWAFSHWDVRALVADPWGWRKELQDLGQEFGDKRVIEFPTNSVHRMAPAVDRFQTAVFSGQLAHDHDAQLARHVLNATVHRSARGPMLDRPDPERHIDAAVACVLAWWGSQTLQPAEPEYSEVGVY